MSRTFGPYLLEKKIADGGMAEVFLATKNGADGWQKPVVVKRILPAYADRREFRQMLFKEASITTTLSHPNIAHMYDYVEIDGYLCIVAEYLSGRDLHDVVLRGNKLIGWENVVHIGCGVLDALHYLHTRKPSVLHRDISLHNLLITYDGVVKLIDFGIARYATESESTSGFRGKRRFMPPEYLHKREYTVHSELYSTGVLLLNLLGVEVETAARLAQQDVPVELRNILQRATQANPQKRHPDVAAMKQELLDCLSAHCRSDSGPQRCLQQLMATIYVDTASRQHQSLVETAILEQRRSAFTNRSSLQLFAAAIGVMLLSVLYPSSMAREPQPAKPLGPTAVVEEMRGLINVNSHPWSSVYLNGNFLGVTPLFDVEVPQGDYLLHMVTADGQRRELPLHVKPGAELSLFEKIH